MRAALGCHKNWLTLRFLAPAMLIAQAAISHAGEEATAPVGGSGPMILAADRVRYWDVGTTRWVILEGRASALQGTEGLRAEEVAVRVEPLAGVAGGGYHVEVHAQGRAQLTHETSRASRSLRIARDVRGEVRIKCHRGGRLEEIDGPPSDFELLARAFPDAPRASDPAAAGRARVMPPALALATPAAPAVPAETGLEEGPAPLDGALVAAQFEPGGFTNPFGGVQDVTAPVEGSVLPPPDMLGPLPDQDAAPLTGPEGAFEGASDLAPPTELPVLPEEAGPQGVGTAPILPGTRRVVSIFPKDSGGVLTSDVEIKDDGRVIIYLRGGLNVVAESATQGVVDVTADNAIIWTRFPQGGAPSSGSVNRLELPNEQPLEIYLEGNVIFRQDARQFAGAGDQKIVEAQQFYMDFRNEWFLAEDARLNVFDSRFITPIKISAQRIQQYRPLAGRGPQGAFYGPSEIRADQSLLTGSRFPTPGYRFRSKSVDLLQVDAPALGPDGKPAFNQENPASPSAPVWQIDARSNAFFIGPVPVFYWPRVLTETDDLDPPIRQIQIRSNNYFGQQILTDWSMFKLLGLERPSFVDLWNLDLDYLSARGFAAGTELGWSGVDLIDNVTDPYNRVRTGRNVDRPYFGYFDAWGLREHRGVDTLGPGPAVITNGPPGSGQQGFQRDASPSYQDYRGQVGFRHMQSFLPSQAGFDQDIRFQFESTYISDRQFLEQYYKNLFDAGLDQKTLGYFIYQNENRAVDVLASANLQYWYTDSQFFPKVQYRRLGDSVLGDYFTWSQVWGADYANTHTDTMVNNPNIFAFQPFDPVSATSGAFSTGRIWTAQELDLPINLDFLRVTPYVQGQLVGWDNQYATSLPNPELNPSLPDQAFVRGPQGAMLGRYWGGAGARANVMAWRNFPGAESELLNVHGMSHKMSFDLDYRTTYSNVDINRIGIQDEIDDNTYEYVRRYFALINYVGGVLPPQYDPRYLSLRRTVSPITGTTDLQDTIQTLQLGWHNRLQTKRGPEGRRRIIDYMLFDLSTTYFPISDRDNFGKPFGQNMYNWEWYVGDRTSIVSNGWAEFWDISGDPILISNPRGTNDPFGLYAITSGIRLNRPPRGDIFIGYSVINTGPISTSALNVSFSYWLSPKWYSSFGTSYDFGNAILLGSTFGITRVGADFLTSIGLTIDPQRQSYMFGFELTPRLSPSIKVGSGGGIARFDSRNAPTQ